MRGDVTTIGSWEAEDVSVGAVEAALSDLRRHEVRAAVRTSVLTLVVVVADRRQADAALQVVYDLGARHPSRTVVVVIDDEGQSPRGGLDACASVHVSEREGMAICFEDVVLTVRGRARYHLDSVVDTFTLPDLPVAVWIPSHLPAPGDPLLTAADRLILDTRAVPEGDDVLARVARLARRLPVSDLSWIRLGPWRSLLAGLFEGGVNRHFLAGVRRVEVAGNPGPRLLLGGWLLERLRLPRSAVSLAPAEHVAMRITAVAESRTGRFGVERPGAERTIESYIDIDGGPSVRQTLRMRHQWPALSLAGALTAMGHDDAYNAALTGAMVLTS